MNASLTVDPATPILIVDDLMSARRILTRMLAHLGFKSVSEAESCAQAIEKIRQGSFALVISDLNLKDGLGTELLSTVRGDPLLKERKIPFIIVTSDMDKSSFNQAIQAGVMSYLLKPFSAEALGERIATCLIPKTPAAP